MKTVLLLFALVVGSGTMWAAITPGDYSAIYTSNVTLSSTGGTNVSTGNIKIGNTSYSMLKAGTGSNYGKVKISVPAGTKYLHLHAAGWNNENITLDVSPTTDVSPTSISLTKNSGISGNPDYTFGTAATDQTANSSYHYKVITFTTPRKGYRFYFYCK